MHRDVLGLRDELPFGIENRRRGVVRMSSAPISSEIDSSAFENTSSATASAAGRRLPAGCDLRCAAEDFLLMRFLAGLIELNYAFSIP
jgi:hypothetical protein